MISELFSKKYKKCTITVIILAVACAAIGPLLHFAFDITNKNVIVGLFAPVNESTWEHLKLLFFPFILTSAIEYFIFGKEAHNFFSSKLIGITAGLIFIITNYYTTVGAFGINSMAVNIGIYIASVFLSFAISYYRMLKDCTIGGGGYEIAAIVIFVLYFAAFTIFSYYPPHIPLFRDPMTMNYSVTGQS